LPTQIVGGQSAVTRAVELLRAGEVVALPTETVYGLAADALNPSAVAKIFEAKERPRFDPLIVHLPNRKSIDSIAKVDSDLVSSLMDKFWPGPLTFVLPKRETIPDIVTAGLETVAVRMSAHPLFQQIVSAFGGPLAAPSANRFGRISPTMAQHVYEELAGRIPLIVDGEPSTVGIESTIARVIDDGIEILRQGAITAEMLREFASVRIGRRDGTMRAPGQLKTHYAPQTKLIVMENLEDFIPPGGVRFGAISLRSLSESGDLREAAANLFRTLRDLDHSNLDLIVAEKVRDEGIGAAINDRLQRAAHENLCLTTGAQS
jgi:L-threonylcarbamoyladenylate synthase